MRERAQHVSAEDMRPQDLLELILYYGIPRRDTKEAAYELLQKFGSLENVLKAGESELTLVTGIGANAARWLKILGEAVEAYSQTEQCDLKKIDTFLAAAEHFKSILKGEETYMLCLSQGGQLISGVKISDNADWGNERSMRTALNEAIVIKAHSVMLGRRSGAFEKGDLIAAERMKRTFGEAEIAFVDFILTGTGRNISMRRMYPEIWK